MTQNDERRQAYEEMLMAVDVQAFDVSTTNIVPFGQSTVSWRVTTPKTPIPIRLRLAGGGLSFPIGLTGSKTVSPVMTSNYNLIASLQTATRIVATRTISVNADACISLTFPEVLIRDEITPTIDEIIAQNPEISRRRDDRIELEPDGLHISLRLLATLDGVGAPDVNVDALVSFRAEQEALGYRMVSYSFDLDWPWWQDALNWFSIYGWLAAEMAEGNEGAQTRAQITSALDTFVGQQQASATGAGMGFLMVTPRTDALDVVLCPLEQTDRGRLRIGRNAADGTRLSGPTAAPR
jgi:hypothetical protein